MVAGSTSCLLWVCACKLLLSRYGDFESVLVKDGLIVSKKAVHLIQSIEQFYEDFFYFLFTVYRCTQFQTKPRETFCCVGQKVIYYHNQNHITKTAAQLIAQSDIKLAFTEGLPADSTIGLPQ